MDQIIFIFFFNYYCLSEKVWPILYSKLLYKVGQDFLDIQYIKQKKIACYLASTFKISPSHLPSWKPIPYSRRYDKQRTRPKEKSDSWLPDWLGTDLYSSPTDRWFRYLQHNRREMATLGGFAREKTVREEINALRGLPETRPCLIIQAFSHNDCMS